MKSILIGFVFAVVVLSSSALAQESWRHCQPNVSCVFGDYMFNDSFSEYTDQICNVSIYYPNQSVWIDNQYMNNWTDGFHNYTPTFTEEGVYPVEMYCVSGNDSLRQSFTIKVTYAQNISQSWRHCELNVSCWIGDFIYNDTYVPHVNQICNITISYPNNTVWVNNQQMQNNSNGFHNYTIIPPVTGFYKSLMHCVNGSDVLKQSLSFVVTSTTHEVSGGPGAGGYVCVEGVILDEDAGQFPFLNIFHIIILIIASAVAGIGFHGYYIEKNVKYKNIHLFMGSVAVVIAVVFFILSLPDLHTLLKLMFQPAADTADNVVRVIFG